MCARRTSPDSDGGSSALPRGYFRDTAGSTTAVGQQFAQFGGTELHKGASRRQVWPGHCPGATGDLRAVFMRLLSHGHLQEFSSPEPAEVTGGCPVLFFTARKGLLFVS